MASTIDDRTGLGWETWLLLALLAGAGAFLFPAMLVLGGIGEAGPFVVGAPSDVPGVDPWRMLAGSVAATVLAVAAVILARRTDWRLDDYPSGFDDDLGEHALLEVIDD